MHTIYQAAQDATITVVGDVILDRYVYGETSRISPEAPVPVVRVTSEEERAGGAANVALNIRQLAIAVKLAGITGSDDSAGRLQGLLTAAGVDCHLHRQDNFPTITKVRVLSQNQQLLRLDYEDAPGNADSGALLQLCRACLDGSNLLVVSDYAKGSLAAVDSIIDEAAGRNVPVLVDPKGRDFSRYRQATVLTPNLKEFEAVAGTCRDDEDLVNRAHTLCKDLSIGAMLITRGARGITLVDHDAARVRHLPAVRHEVFDVTGAGDTVIATFAAALVSGYDMEDAVDFANHAAGIVIGKLGTACVSSGELNSAINDRHYPGGTVPDLPRLLEIIATARGSGERIVMTNGCFDILHAGHIACLEAAKSMGDRLLVAINDDESVTRLKGAGRPVNTLEHRARLLSALSVVDWVVAFAADTPEEVIRAVSPDVLVKGGDYQLPEIAGADHVIASGGEVKLIPLLPGISSSSIINNLQHDTDSS